MRRLILSATAALIVLAAASAAHGGDAVSTPLHPALALKGGAWVTDVNGVDAAPAYGAELALDDPWIEPAVGKIRHMLSYNHAAHDGLTLNTAEWNAHWVFQTQRDLWLGAGPGLGYAWVDGRDRDDSPAVQFGMSATYVRGHMLVGFESRYQWTAGDSTDNWLSMIKLGYQF